MIGMLISFFALAMLLMLFTVLLHRDRAKNKEYNPTFKTYLLYLSTPTAEKEEEAREELQKSGKPSFYAIVLASVLAVMLVAVVLLTLIPGGKG